MSDPMEELPWPRWTVREGAGAYNVKRQQQNEGVHRLLYLGEAVNSAKGVSGLNAMRKQAAFMNERRLTPNPAVECLADMTPSERARLSIKKKI